MQQISSWQKLTFCVKCCSFACLSPACVKSEEWGRWLFSLSHCSLPVFSVIPGSPRDTICEDVPSNKLVLNCPIQSWEWTWAGFSWSKAVTHWKCAQPDFSACGWLHCRGWAVLCYNHLEVLTISGSHPTFCLYICAVMEKQFLRYLHARGNNVCAVWLLSLLLPKGHCWLLVWLLVMDLHAKHAQVLSTLHAYNSIFHGYKYILVIWKIGQASFRGSFPTLIADRSSIISGRELY